MTVKNVDTGLERSTQTSADGSYSVPELPIGTYTVTISQSGFQTSVTTNVVVDVASERRVDASLQAGQVSQTVEVSGEALSQVDTTSAQLGGTLTQETIANLPVNGRDYTKLIYLNPGVCRVTGPDFRFSRIVRHFLDEWFTRPLEQFSAGRHRHE